MLKLHITINHQEACNVNMDIILVIDLQSINKLKSEQDKFVILTDSSGIKG